MVDVQPGLQIVWRMVSCRTSGFSAPGVHFGSGKGK
jgi:hypothetical protein